MQKYKLYLVDIPTGNSLLLAMLKVQFERKKEVRLKLLLTQTILKLMLKLFNNKSDDDIGQTKFGFY